MFDIDNNNIVYRFNESTKINIEYCTDLIKKKEITLIEQGGQSKIYNINGNKCNSLIVKKINDNKRDIQSFKKEKYFYHKTNKMIMNNICPHFLLMYGLDDSDNSFYLEKADGTLLNFFKIDFSNKINFDSIIKSMIFQLLYGIMVIQTKLKTFHTDLHMKNIFYKRINEKYKYFKYFLDDQIYLVPNYGYLFIIADFGHAQTLENINSSDLNVEDIEFGIKYNYDFTHLEQMYNKLLKENISLFINSIEELKKYISFNDNIKKIYYQYEITIDNKFKNLNRELKSKKILNLMIYYCIDNNLFDIESIKTNFIYNVPNLKMKKFIENIFNSKNNIENLIVDNFDFYLFYKDSKQNLSNNEIIKEFYYYPNKNKINNTQLSRTFVNNNINDNIINKIKELYGTNRFNYNTTKYFFLSPKKNFIPKFIKPMYQNIQPFDYIQPIINLNKRFSNKYYVDLIKRYNFKDKTRLDLYKESDTKDIDEIMLQYLKCRHDCFIITVWPIFVDFTEQLIKYLEPQGFIYYVKYIDFEKTGLINYLISVYDEFDDTDVVKIAKDKYSWSRPQNKESSGSNKISIIIFDNINKLGLAGQASRFKTVLRNWGLELLGKTGIDTTEIRGNDLIHINDYFYQTIEYAQLLLNSNSVKFLNSRLYDKVYSDYFTKTHLKIETYRKTIYSNLSLETICSLFLIAGTTLYFYGFRPIDDIDGICINPDPDYFKKTDANSEDIKKITKLFSDEKTRIFYIEFGTTNTSYWKEKWTNFNSIIANYFHIENFNDICWNPKHHFYFKGIKCYLIDFEFYKKLQRSNEIIGTNIWPTLSKDYTDYIMINHLNPKIIKDFIYVNSDGKLKVTDSICNIYPKLKNLPFNEHVLEQINKFLISKYKTYLNENINDNYIKSLFNQNK